MSISMDGHTITKLELHGENGSVVTKDLVEQSSGSMKTITGYLEVAGNTIYGDSVYLSIQNADVLSGCTNFVVLLQLVQTGVLETPGDPTSEATMDTNPRSYDNTVKILSHAIINEGDFCDFDSGIVYPLTRSKLNGIITEISQTNMWTTQRDCGVSMSGNELRVNIPSTILSHRNMYMKFSYTVYAT